MVMHGQTPIKFNTEKFDINQSLTNTIFWQRRFDSSSYTIV